MGVDGDSARRNRLRALSHAVTDPGAGGRTPFGNVVYRDNCNFLWNNDKDTIYFYKPTGSRADVHSYTKSGSDPDGNGYVGFHS